MSQPVLVPINVEAKVLSSPQDVPNIQSKVVSGTVHLPAGVHLHWALPSALTTARTQAQEDATDDAGNTPGSALFPGVPDRWLVVRINPTPKARLPAKVIQPRAWRAWWVDSHHGRCQELTDSSSLQDSNGGAGASSVDTVFGPMPSAEEQGMKAWGLSPTVPTADTLAAAYYPSARGRFGFHDDLADLNATTPATAYEDNLTYCVIGWYSTPDKDPLATESRSRSELLERWKWVGRWLAAHEGQSDTASNTKAKAAASASLNPGELQIADTPARAAKNYLAKRSNISLTQVAMPPGILHSGGIASLLSLPTDIICHGSIFSVAHPLNLKQAASNPLTSRVMGSTTIHRAAAEASLPTTSASSDSAATREQRDYLVDLAQAELHGDQESLTSESGLADVHARLHAQTFQSVPGVGQRFLSIELPALNLGLLGALGQTRPHLQVARAAPAAPTINLDPNHQLAQQIYASAHPEEAARKAAQNVAAARQADRWMLRVVRPVLGSDTRQHIDWLDLRRPTDMRRLLGWAKLDVILDRLKQARVFTAPGPRWYRPWAPHIAIKDVGRTRSMRHGGDTRYLSDGALACRKPAEIVASIAVLGGKAAVAANNTANWHVLGRELLTDLSRLNRPDLPSVVTGLVAETALLDPGHADDLARLSLSKRQIASTADETARVRDGLLARAYLRASEHLASQQTSTEALQRQELSTRVKASLAIRGVQPSPVALTQWSQPWIPLVAEVCYRYIPHPIRSGWSLHGTPIGASVAKGTPESADRPEPIAAEMGLNGSSNFPPLQLLSTQPLDKKELVLLSASIARIWNSSFSTSWRASFSGAKVPTQPHMFTGLTGLDTSVLKQVRFQNADILSGSLVDFDHNLAAAGSGERAGTLLIKEVRVIDGFGECRRVDFGKTDNPATGDAHPDSATPSIVLPPRLPYWARLQFRLTSADDDQSDATADSSPICGYLLPDLLEHAMEVFDADGKALGQIECSAPIRDATDVNIAASLKTWFKPHPWVSASSGEPLETITNPHLQALVQGLVEQPPPKPQEAGLYLETALTGLMRSIETARLSVDPADRTNDWRMRILGSPIAVLRARMWLQTSTEDDPHILSHSDSPVSTVTNLPPVSVKVGDESRPDDGVLGIFVPGSGTAKTVAAASRFVCVSQTAVDQALLVDPESGTVVSQKAAHRFLNDFSAPVDANALVTLDPAQEVTHLTLLQDLRGGIALTSGLLPRKRIDIPPEWLQTGFDKLEPSLKVGPIMSVQINADEVDLVTSGPRIPGYALRWMQLSGQAGSTSLIESTLGPQPKVGDVPPTKADLRRGWFKLVPNPEG